MNVLTYGNFEFDDNSIFSIEINTEVDPISASLSADVLTATVFSNKTGERKLFTRLMEWYSTVNNEGFVIEDENMENYTYGDPLYYYRDGELYGKFYISQVTRIAESKFRITALSGIGIMVYQTFAGGVYEPTTAGTIIDEIMAGTNIDYTISGEVAGTIASGYIPYGNKRDALQQLLFPLGANIKKSSNGSPEFVYNDDDTYKPITGEHIYINGKNEYFAPTTQIVLTEHEYYESSVTEEEELYSQEDIAVDNSFMVFDDPIIPSSVRGTGTINITEVTATYIRFSGAGSIFGKKYAHNKQDIVWNAPTVNGEAKVRKVPNATMVSSRNSANTMNRLVAYYTSTKETNVSIVLDGERAGDFISFTDPYGLETTGMITSLDVNVSAQNKAAAKVLQNWTPAYFGDSYTAYQEFDETDIVSGVLTIPPAMVGKQALVCLIGGAGGGQGGFNGADGYAPSGLANFEAKTPGTGGIGGNGGQPGLRSKFFSFYVTSLPASYSNASVGVGGDGGASNGGLGEDGTPTTLASYSSDNGVRLSDDYINLLDQTVYGNLGAVGEDGADGGTGVNRGNAYGDATGSTDGDNHTCGDGTVYTGGLAAQGTYYTYKRGSNSRRYEYIGGAGGGGAAHGSNGSNGYVSTSYETQIVKDGSWGGDGANATAPPTASRTQTGNGGHGGGGGGGAFQCQSRVEGSSVFSYGSNYGGVGGSGSNGGQGGNGLIVIYYNA